MNRFQSSMLMANQMINHSYSCHFSSAPVVGLAWDGAALPLDGAEVVVVEGPSHQEGLGVAVALGLEWAAADLETPTSRTRPSTLSPPTSVAWSSAKVGGWLGALQSHMGWLELVLINISLTAVFATAMCM
jgi:hypothetical protein